MKTNLDGSFQDYKRFSSVVKLFLSISANEQMILKQFDVSTAFLYSKLEEIICIKQPKGYDGTTHQICKFKRSLYDRKQSRRCFNKRFGSVLSYLRFRASEANAFLYIRAINSKKH